MSARFLGMMLAVGLAPLTAQAAGVPTDDQCRAAYEQGQRKKKKHALKAARADFLLCARDPCPKAFQPECIDWLAEVEKLIPTIVPLVVSADGQPRADVRVFVDGTLVADRIDGTAIALDPGEHVFRFEPRDGKPIEQSVLMVEGVGGRVLRVELPALAVNAPPAPPPPPPPKPPATTEAPGPSSWAYVFGAVAVVGGASFGYFGATGLAKRNALDDCQPHCLQNDIDSARTRFLIADVSLAVAVVSLGVSTYLFVARRGAAPAPTAAITWTPGGASVTCTF